MMMVGRLLNHVVEKKRHANSGARYSRVRMEDSYGLLAPLYLMEEKGLYLFSHHPEGLVWQVLHMIMLLLVSCNNPPLSSSLTTSAPPLCEESPKRPPARSRRRFCGSGSMSPSPMGLSSI